MTDENSKIEESDEVRVEQEVSPAPLAIAAPEPPKAQPARLWIGIPTRAKTIAMGTALSLLATYRDLTQIGVELAIHTFAEMGVILARNVALAEFMADDAATHFLFVDDDTVFDPATILVLLNSGLDAVGGAYPTRGTDWASLVARMQDGQIQSPEDAAMMSSPLHVRWDASSMPGGKFRFEQNRFVEVAGLGTGFLLLSRACVAKLFDRAPKVSDPRPPGLRFEGDLRLIVKNDLGAPTKENGQKYVFWGEDYSLCNEIRAAGFRLYADVLARFEHVGPTTFASYSLGEFMAIGKARSGRK